jgi:hypothetical protein
MPVEPEWEDDGIRGEPWCKDFDGHKAVHEFCSDHQAMWCRICDGQCDECVEDPHCRWCHCAIFEEEHDWDCPNAE